MIRATSTLLGSVKVPVTTTSIGTRFTSFNALRPTAPPAAISTMSQAGDANPNLIALGSPSKTKNSTIVVFVVLLIVLVFLETK